MRELSLDTIRECLRAFFASADVVQLAYVFGSEVEGKTEPLSDIDEDSYLRDVVKRNLEVAAQCCIDICNRTSATVITLESAAKPQDYYEAIRRQGELGVLPSEFARELAPIAGFRNVLAHQYLGVDWDEVYDHLHRLDELDRFTHHIQHWLRGQQSSGR